jgi:hypothetical protein
VQCPGVFNDSRLEPRVAGNRRSSNQQSSENTPYHPR